MSISTHIYTYVCSYTYMYVCCAFWTTNQWCATFSHSRPSLCLSLPPSFPPWLFHSLSFSFSLSLSSSPSLSCLSPPSLIFPFSPPPPVSLALSFLHFQISPLFRSRALTLRDTPEVCGLLMCLKCACYETLLRFLCASYASHMTVSYSLDRLLLI